MDKKSIVISLFDLSTESVKPWANAGYICYCFDIQHKMVFDSIEYGKGMIITGSHDLQRMSTIETIKTIIGDGKQVAFMSAFPPCTDLAVSGAKHFDKKLKANPDYRKQAMNLVYISDYIGKFLKCPYYIENPVSVISTEWRKPDFIFNPYDYGGYIPENEAEHPLYPELIMPRDAYPKKTCLWTGGGFELPEKKPVEIKPGFSEQYKRLGGKSLKTKNIRSATPRGFAIACYEKYGV